jgi:hypothetical protein
MRHLTVRNIPHSVATALEQEKQERGTSLNKTVIDALRRGLGVEDNRPSNGLGRLAGKWSDDELRRFQDAVRVTEQIDEELWR